MLPFDEGSKAKRNINLGGNKSQSSHGDLLDRARALRSSRRDERNKEEAAKKIQNWIRSQKEIRTVRHELKVAFDHGPDGEQAMTYVNWTRLLLFSGTDESRLTEWSREMLRRKHDVLLGLFDGPAGGNWLTLMKPIALTVLKYSCKSPSADQTLLFLQIVDTILTSFASDPESSRSQQIALLTQYLIRQNAFRYLGQSLSAMPVSAKTPFENAVYNARIVATILSIATVFPDAQNPTFPFTQFFHYLLVIPLLPNRIPIKALPYFASKIPWAQLTVLSSSLNQLVYDISEPSRAHVLANLMAFIPPHYSKFPPPVLASYIQLYSVLLDSVDSKILEGRSAKQVATLANDKEKVVVLHDDMDTDDEDIGFNQNHINDRPDTSSPTHMLDTRTLNRLSTLTKSSHLSALLLATSHNVNVRGDFFRLAVGLTAAFPSRRSQLWTDISVINGGGSGLIRECWRGYVRSSPLGKVSDDGAIKTLMDPLNASFWAPLLFLVMIYTQSLLTVGDDEFFSTSTSSAAVSRNPLSMDDLVVFSRQLLNIAFPLYWLDDQTKIKSSGPQNIPLTWETIREHITSCLKGIHIRDSRRSFTPPGHWLVSSQVNMSSFVEAAIIEEQTLSGEPSSDAVVESRRRFSPRQLAQISPRLGVLNNIPFAIPFEVRVEIFRQFVKNDYDRTVANNSSGNLFDRFFNRPTRKRAVVRRGNIARDGFDQLSGLTSELKGPIEIQFIDQFGQEEAGIDGGGVFKEFLTSLSKEVFDPNRGLWLTTQQQELYPNPHSYATEPYQLEWFKFIGHILGKALYEGILIDVVFAPFFLAKWLGKQSYLDDLASLDPELYNGLIFLKHYDKNFEDLSLNFTVSEDEFGVSRSVNLIRGGDEISVTRENRLQYIYLVCHYRLNRQIKRQSQAFFDGLSDIIDPKWLRMFNQQELQILIGGTNASIDIDDLRANCNYGGVYDDNEETIQLLWKVVNSFNQEQRRGLLRFVTSCSRPPLLGFKELYPKFCIRDSTSDEQRLPTSSTCVNLLKLPRYKSERVLREKLLQAINAGAGFDLS